MENRSIHKEKSSLLNWITSNEAERYLNQKLSFLNSHHRNEFVNNTHKTLEDGVLSFEDTVCIDFCSLSSKLKYINHSRSPARAFDVRKKKSFYH